ncbi:MAG TPA: DinB family protein, partial [Terriglobales bacterium]|nr:DinB family protein [Terriglobales bacterium]
MTTTTLTAERPKPGEYDAYYDRYISLVLGNDIIATLEKQLSRTLAILSARSEAEGDFRYAPGKWTLKEVLGHLNDTERIMACRALRIARGDQTPLAGFEQDDYIRDGPFADLALAALIEEFKSIRAATLTLLRGLRPQDWTRRGIANSNHISVRALAYIIAGHELHHRSILEERYFGVQ